MINSAAFLTYEPGLASQRARQQPDSFVGIVGQKIPGSFQTDLLAVAVVIGLLLLLEHFRPKL